MILQNQVMQNVVLKIYSQHPKDNSTGPDFDYIFFKGGKTKYIILNFSTFLKNAIKINIMLV